MIPGHLASDRKLELETAFNAGRQAAKVILEFYEDQTAKTYTKGDGSPVTDADLASDAVIRTVLGEAFPDDALLTEEGAKDLDRLAHRRCWIVDPIDGTAQYVGRTGLFDVMIALVIDGQVEVAVAVQPVSSLVQAAVRGAGAWEIRDGEWTTFAIAPSGSPCRFVASKYYRGRESKDLLARVAARIGAAFPPILEIGFQSRNFSEGSRTFDAFVGLPPPSHVSIAQEWDLAAVDLIVTEGGGRLTDCWGRPHRYNKRDTGISGGLVGSSDPDIHARLLTAIAPELGDPPPADPADDPAIA